MHHWDSWVLPSAAQPTVPLRWACFLVLFQPDLRCPHMALWLKVPPIPFYGSSAVFLHATAAATAAVFSSSPQIKNSLLGRWASIWKIACGRMKHVTTFSHTGLGQRWLAAINHPFSPGRCEWASGKWHSRDLESFSAFPQQGWLELEQETPLSEENGRHCGSKGHRGCQAPAFPLTHHRSNKKRTTGTKALVVGVTISQTLVTAAI